LRKAYWNHNCHHNGQKWKMGNFRHESSHGTNVRNQGVAYPKSPKAFLACFIGGVLEY
jgi:hypothetical protein